MPADTTDWDRVARLTDEEIAAAVAEDPDAAPLADEALWKDARLVLPPPKAAISIRLDEDILAWFRGTGRGWQTRINAVLRAYVDVQRRTGKD
jgi:uncharacterized protein (DUF4415 family)